MLKKLAVLAALLSLAFGVVLVAGRSATFVCSRSLTIDEPPAAVWSVATDAAGWPHWWPGVVGAHLPAGWQVGGVLELELKGRTERAPARVDVFIPERQLSWSQPGVLGSITRTALRLVPAAGGTEVTLESSIHGPQAVFARVTGRAAFGRYQQVVLNALRFRLQRREGSADRGEKHARL